jgi:two-component system, sensor histidine kinase ChiS
MDNKLVGLDRFNGLLWGRLKAPGLNHLMSTISTYKGQILIVDDDPVNLGLLFEMLKAQQFIVRVANSGRLALAAINSSPPDLILLDINMPIMNGYEVCECIKADPGSHEIPVIFISASDEAIDKVRAFKAGGIDYVTKPFQIEEVLARIESQLKIAHLSHELKMQMLRYQLDPHFLFNSLNSIRTLISIDGEAAEEMVMQLSAYLRYLLSGRNRLDISIYEEIEGAQNYLAIEKIRFKSKLIVRMDVDPEAEHSLIPSSLIQPLLENAVKYGMKSHSKPLEITVSVKLKNDRILLNVSNTGKWVTPAETGSSTGLGVGLANIRQRLRQRYPGQHNFTISHDQEHVDALIEIPFTQS